MLEASNKHLKANSPYTAVITREQFLFYEMRITAGLLAEGLAEAEIVNRVVEDNLFQYPTGKSSKRMVQTCLRRLAALGDSALVQAIANESVSESKQICLYAMMKQYRLVWDFMITVVGEKYATLDTSFSKKDINSFFLRLQEQDDWVATWSESTVDKIKQVLLKLLVDNGYLERTSSASLQPVLLQNSLLEAIQNKGETKALLAFNYIQ